MSAIFGILNHNQCQVDQHDLRSMYQSMVHRGADDTGFWSSGAVGLGHGMFWTTPQALGEKLPFDDAESGLVLTADARIDNREELIKKLGLSSSHTKDLPDSRYIMLAYQKWGEKCVDHLLGDFSFAIWDARANKLFCARDHLGIKPFNYYQDHQTLAFATEAEAVLKAPGVKQKVNEGRIIDCLESSLEGYDLTSTFFEEVKRLPPAHTLTAMNGRVSIQRYWLPDPTRRITLGSDEEYVEAFNEIYTDAVAQRMRSNDNVASMLSGGMDSSSIVGIARDLHQAKTGKPFPVFSAVSSDDPDCQDTHFIQMVLNQGGLSANNVSIEDLKELNSELTNVVKSAREPFDPMIMIIAIYLQAKKSGFRVMLDGIDGDMVHSLTPFYPSFLLREGQYQVAFNEARLYTKHSFGGKLSTAKFFLQNVRAAYTPKFLRKLKRHWRFYDFLDGNTNPVISASFKKEQCLSKRLSQLSSHSIRDNYNGLPQSSYTQHASAILHPYLTVGIERYDRVAALCGIEPRHPLLDKRLVDFMVAIPWNQKVRSGWSKYLLRTSASKMLPDEVCWRKGWEHIGWTFEKKWLSENYDDVSKMVENMLAKRAKYFNIQTVKRMINELTRDGIEEGQDNEAGSLLPLYHLSNWVERRG